MLQLEFSSIDGKTETLDVEVEQTTTRKQNTGQNGNLEGIDIWGLKSHHL